jgi:hypothetical protein
MSEPTPRQVLYALVAVGFVLVVVILTIGGVVAGLVPAWWSAVMGLTIASTATYIAQNWRRTGPVLVLAIGVLVMWMVGTLILAT